MASRFTAMSLDVRKVYDLPVALPKFMGLRPVNWGAAPKPKADFGRWGIAATAHQAAEPRKSTNGTASIADLDRPEPLALFSQATRPISLRQPWFIAERAE